MSTFLSPHPTAKYAHTRNNVDESVKLIVEGSLHFVDCYPSSSCGVLYLDEGAVVSEDKAARRRLEKVSKVNLTSGSVLSLYTFVDIVF